MFQMFPQSILMCWIPKIKTFKRQDGVSGFKNFTDGTGGDYAK